MTTITSIDAGSSRQSTRRLWWSAGVHATILLLCLAISAIPPTPASAIERPRVILIAPTPVASIPPAPKKITARVEPKIVSAPMPEPKLTPRVFIAPASRSPAPIRPAQVEIATLQLLEPIAPVIPSAEPLAPSQLPPPPIVVGKLSGATSSSAPAQSGVVTTRTGFSTSTGAITTEPKQARAIASGFQGAAIANAPSLRATAASIPITRPVEIIKKPQPVYTEEARALRLEGEVLLEVLFTASADVRVLRVTRGLGHGLDEAAVASASRIEFRPALREGEPADQTVTVHIRFQLAY